ncbi:hypothetical protein [Bacteriovorax sp. Seq25_V]|uniref:hypothetical protein n=1 Tax=Bacteriovorax sp. Seq25_V TaxID=1201288 RepID=UPI00038A0A7F|nr:hypothetical protein [Bacteriovorax sp. Seq25_V]EQC43954.1 hypothetical protein M900_1383 [Bacteriovorax sp. Seq25_V]
MKTLISILIISNIYALEVLTAKNQKFVTTFQNYACKSFRDKASTPTELAELDMEFTLLGVSDSTRNITMDLMSSDGSCSYHAYFSRKKGEKFLNFESSVAVGDEVCTSKKEAIDALMVNGFRYVIKFNAYISLLFMTKVNNECLETSGNNLVEFTWEI